MLAQQRVCFDAQAAAIGEWRAFLKKTEARRQRDSEFDCQVTRGCMVAHQQPCPATICTEYKDDTVVDWVATMGCVHRAERGII